MDRIGEFQFTTTEARISAVCIVAAWNAGELSEGQVCRALGIDRIAARELRDSVVEEGKKRQAKGSSEQEQVDTTAPSCGEKLTQPNPLAGIPPLPPREEGQKVGWSSAMSIAGILMIHLRNHGGDEILYPAHDLIRMVAHLAANRPELFSMLSSRAEQQHAAGTSSVAGRGKA